MRTGPAIHVRLLALLALTACSNILGIEPLTGVDAGPGSDVIEPGPDGPSLPDVIVISGQVQRTDPTLGGSFTVELHTLDEQLVTSAPVEAATNMFSLTVPTSGAPVSCYLEVLDATGQAVNTRFYFARPLVANTNVGLNAFTQNEIMMLAIQGASSFDPATGAMLILVSNGNGPASNAVVDLMGPGDLRYGREPDGAPTGNLPATTSSGLAWAFRVPPSVRSITASTPGVQFTGPPVNIRPGSFTMLTIQP
jgi:hypothetical protein